MSNHQTQIVIPGQRVNQHQILALPHRAAVLALLVCCALGGTAAPAAARSTATARPLADFVNVQGTYDFGFLFVPPVPNFLGWSDPAGLSLSIDYAGLADRTCNGVAGTVFAGTVAERLLPDGRAEVSVELFTRNAITWAVNGTDFANGPVVFGVRWQEDPPGRCALAGTPALGTSLLRVTFRNTAPGAPLPDLVQLLVAPEPGQEFVALAIDGFALSNAGGRPALAEVHQAAKMENGELTFSAEKVAVRNLR
jgi:hypothetical protein